MEHTPPRLHREFFDRIMQVEAILQDEAFLTPEEVRSIVDKAISRYCYETRKTFSNYLRDELEMRPAILGRIPADALEQLLCN